MLVGMDYLLSGAIMENASVTKVWTRQEIGALIIRNDRAVERAMVSLWEKQEEDERTDAVARHHNGRGFAHWSVGSGTYFANWVRSGRHLSGKHLAKARKIAMYHVGQLTRMANAKAEINKEQK